MRMETISTQSIESPQRERALAVNCHGNQDVLWIAHMQEKMLEPQNSLNRMANKSWGSPNWCSLQAWELILICSFKWCMPGILVTSISIPLWNRQSPPQIELHQSLVGDLPKWPGSNGLRQGMGPPFWCPQVDKSMLPPKSHPERCPGLRWQLVPYPRNIPKCIHWSTCGRWYAHKSANHVSRLVTI